MNRKIVDLSLPIYTGMTVYPGDPEVSIELIQTIEADDWNLRQISISSHIGTHVNVPAHSVKDGKTLDDYSLESFMGRAHLFRKNMPVPTHVGVIFHDHNIDREIADWIVLNKPPFVGLSSKFEIDVDIEKCFLEAEIILYENLANTHQLPDSFTFFGVPLKITKGDGCPVRAFAVVEDNQGIYSTQSNSELSYNTS